MYEELTKGKFKTLDILHHYTSGLKSIYSQSCYDGLDQIRLSCGGAGYSPVPTYEGDNTVMAQQSLNYLQKKLKQIKAGKKATGVLSYLNNIDTLCNIKSDATTVATFSDLNHLDNALAVRAAYKVRDVLGKLENTKEKKVVLLNDIYAQEIV